MKAMQNHITTAQEAMSDLTSALYRDASGVRAGGDLKTLIDSVQDISRALQQLELMVAGYEARHVCGHNDEYLDDRGLIMCHECGEEVTA
jgi:hypothetical protein